MSVKAIERRCIIWLCKFLIRCWVQQVMGLEERKVGGRPDAYHVACTRARDADKKHR